MCDASDYAVGAVLGQRHAKFFHAIYYASKVLNNNQANYTTIEKELLAVIFALKKFRPYLILTKPLMQKQVLKARRKIQKSAKTERSGGRSAENTPAVTRKMAVLIGVMYPKCEAELLHTLDEVEGMRKL
jgi:hypothetical protein